MILSEGNLRRFGLRVGIEAVERVRIGVFFFFLRVELVGV